MTISAAGRLPKAADGYPAVASRPASEQIFDFLIAHSVKIVRHLNFPFKKSKPAQLPGIRSVQPHYLDQRLASLGNDKRFPCTASATSFDKCVFASWIFTVCMTFPLLD
jgi:hypothetical protein